MKTYLDLQVPVAADPSDPTVYAAKRVVTRPDAGDARLAMAIFRAHHAPVREPKPLPVATHVQRNLLP